MNTLLVKSSGQVNIDATTNLSKIVNSAKKETSSDFQLFFLSVNLMCVNICINTKRVNTIRHKRKMFHRHVTNRKRIICP